MTSVTILRWPEGEIKVEGSFFDHFGRAIVISNNDMPTGRTMGGDFSLLRWCWQKDKTLSFDGMELPGVAPFAQWCETMNIEIAQSVELLNWTSISEKNPNARAYWDLTLVLRFKSKNDATLFRTAWM